jgi:hypothetical protein
MRNRGDVDFHGFSLFILYMHSASAVYLPRPESLTSHNIADMFFIQATLKQHGGDVGERSAHTHLHTTDDSVQQH